jgi:hypothetical protein
LPVIKCGRLSYNYSYHFTCIVYHAIVNNILKNEDIPILYIIQLLIVYRLYLLVKAAAEAVYKIGLLAIKGSDFSMEIVCKIKIGVDAQSDVLAFTALCNVVYLLILDRKPQIPVVGNTAGKTGKGRHTSGNLLG